MEPSFTQPGNCIIRFPSLDEDTLFHHLPASTLECHQGTVLASSKMSLSGSAGLLDKRRRRVLQGAYHR